MKTAPEAPAMQQGPPTTGARIRALRKGLKWTQNELADRLEELGVPVGRSYISILEQSDRLPSGEVVRALADAFDVTADYLLLRTDRPEPPVAAVETPALQDGRDIEALNRRLTELASPVAARAIAAFHQVLDAMQVAEPGQEDETELLDEQGQSLLAAFRAALEEGRVSVEQVTAFLAEEELLHPTTPSRSKKRIPRRQKA